MKLSVNILTWNTVKTLHDTLRILAGELKDIDAEVIIVDNGSTDGCQDYATIKNPTNLGISKAKNQGLEISTGEYIMLLDGDIVPVPNSIRCLLEFMEENTSCEAIGFRGNKFSTMRNSCLLEYANRANKIPECDGLEWDGPRGVNHQHNHETYCHKLTDLEEHRAHCIYYGMYHRSVFDRGIRLDEKYDQACKAPNGNFHGGYGWEDLDVYMQMEKLGIKQWVAGINHKCGKYHHAINSSIKQMGYENYMSSSLKRSQIFKSKWPKVNVVA